MDDIKQRFEAYDLSIKGKDLRSLTPDQAARLAGHVCGGVVLNGRWQSTFATRTMLGQRVTERRVRFCRNAIDTHEGVRTIFNEAEWKANRARVAAER